MVRKLGVKAGHSVILRGAPPGWAVPDLPPDVVCHEAIEPPPAPPAVFAPAIADPTASAPTTSTPTPSTPTPSASAAISPAPTPAAGPISPSDVADVVIAFCRTPEDLATAIAAYGRVIYPAGALWIAWPRRAAGHRSDVTDNLIRDQALPLGLVDTKVAALDTDWSALKLVWRKDRRSSPTSHP